MSHENKILHISLFVGLVGVLVGGAANGAVRIGNKTKNDVYRQMVAANAVAANNALPVVAANETELPLRVANADLAKDIQSGTASISAGQLEACSRIYPDGEFAWDKPTAGIGAGGASTCVAVVELRTLAPNSVTITNPNAPQYVTLARANVAAGSTIKCNISDFPEYSYTMDAQNVVFPADDAPTVEDVKKVMNQEQKQNAALKIAAGALVGGIGGNIAGKNDIGKDGIVGTDKGKVQGTIIGALSGAAIGAGGSYAGKVGGDMIMSTGVNAAAGGIVGNIMASGDSVLRIEDCKKVGTPGNAKCLWGYIIDGDRVNEDDEVYYSVSEDIAVSCKDGACNPERVSSVKIKFNGEVRELNSLKESERSALNNGGGVTVFHMEPMGNGKYQMKESQSGKIYVKIVDAVRPKNNKPALVWGISDKFFGMKRSDWYTWKNANPNAEIYWRNTQGQAEGDPITTNTLNDFEPMFVSAEDGGIIDLDNKARLKGTMIGAGVGGAAGAFTAYQGAQSDIDERWVSATREYRDSLQKFYCATGNRFMSYYNDVAVVPNINE